MQSTGGAMSGRYSGPLQVVSSSYGMADNSAAVRPPDCVGVVFGAEQRVYADSGFEAVRSQTLAPDDYSSHPSTVVQQTVVVFSSDEQARSILQASTSLWRSCSTGDADPDPQIPPYRIDQDAGEGGWAFHMTPVEATNTRLAVKFAGISNLEGTRAGVPGGDGCAGQCCRPGEGVPGRDERCAPTTHVRSRSSAEQRLRRRDRRRHVGQGQNLTSLAAVQLAQSTGRRSAREVTRPRQSPTDAWRRLSV
jgi:hypothetical protein